MAHEEEEEEVGRALVSAIASRDYEKTDRDHRDTRNVWPYRILTRLNLACVPLSLSLSLARRK